MHKHPSKRVLGLVLIGSLALQACAPVILGGAATGALVATDRRTTGTVIDDSSITLSAEQRIAGDKRFEAGHININTYNGRVLITGEVPHDSMRQQIEALLREDKSVKEIHNELAISAPSSWTARTSDSLITARVKANLLEIDIEGFNPNDVSVTTERGIVYLMGLVTATEAEAITNVARTTPGVRKLVRIFEYQQQQPAR